MEVEEVISFLEKAKEHTYSFQEIPFINGNQHTLAHERM